VSGYGDVGHPPGRVAATRPGRRMDAQAVGESCTVTAFRSAAGPSEPARVRDAMAVDVIGLTDPSWQRHDYLHAPCPRRGIGREMPGFSRGSDHRPRRPRVDRRLQRHAAGLCQLHRSRSAAAAAVRSERKQPDANSSGRLYGHLRLRSCRAERHGHGRTLRARPSTGSDPLHHAPALLQLPQGADAGKAARRSVFRREWQAGHPDYAWVAAEYDRLVDHYRSRGNSFAHLAPAEEGVADS